MNANARAASGLHHPRRWRLHSFFVSVGGTLLIAAFPSDVMYMQTSLMQWSNASEWLIAVGLICALLAAVFLFVEVATDGFVQISWLDFGLLAAAAVTSLVNAFVHSRDAWATVQPEGIWLSGIAALLLIIVGVRGWTATRGRLVRSGDRS